MMHRLGALSFLLLALGVVTSSERHGVRKRDASDLKLVCYYSNWAVYRPGLAKFTPQNINPYLCTHLIYAFAALSGDFDLRPFDPYNDIEQGNYKSFVGLKAYNPNLKTLIAVGGWNEGSKRFSRLVESPTNRQTFVRSAVRFLREYGFDGLDLDWEYPAFRDGGNETDKSGYSQLVKELRIAIDSERVPPGKDRLLLSVAVPAGKDYIDLGFDVPTIAKNADFLNLLTYDYHTAYEPETHHHAPLFPPPEVSELDRRRNFNVEWTVDYYLQLGAPSHKLVVGIPTYGRSYTLLDARESGFEAAAAGPGEEGLATREKGYLAFYEICQKVKDDEWEVEAPLPHRMGPYAYSGNQWVGFDDEEMVSLKARFIVDRGLGGAMVWTLDNDDFRGLCTGEQSPLVSALRSALLSNVIEGSSSQRSVARSAGPASAITVHFDDEASSVDEVAAAPRRRTTLRRLVQNRQSARRANTNSKSNALTTPAPPPTPDPGFTFECKDEGFYNNPRDCRKYFWCLDSGPANLGIVAHAFTCPSGLYFNSATESCDYPDNVVCTVKSGGPQTTKAPKSRLARPRGRVTTTTTTTTPPPPPPTTTTEIPEILEDDVNNGLTNQLAPGPESSSGNENVAELLRLLQAIGGVEKLQSLLGSQERSSDILPTTTPSPQSLPEYVPPQRVTTVYYTDPPSTDAPPAPFPQHDYRQEVNPYHPATLPPTSENSYVSEEPLLTQQVPRRPQFEPSSPELFQYVKPERNRDVVQDGGSALLHEDQYPFQYQTPPRENDPEPEIVYEDPRAEEENARDAPAPEVFSYQTPIRQTTVPPTVPTPTEAPTPEPTAQPAQSDPTEQEGNKGAYRTPIRVQVGRVVRIQNGDGNGPRRRMRVRVRPVQAGSRISESGQVARAVGRIGEEPKVTVADPPPVAVLLGNGKERVAVRRRPVFANNYDNAPSTGVRLVARQRRPQDLNGQARRGQPGVDYVAVRRVPVPESEALPTEAPVATTTAVTVLDSHHSTGSDVHPVRPGYQPPLYQPPINAPSYDGEEAAEEYDDTEYTDLPEEELDNYFTEVDEEPKPATTLPPTTTPQTTTTEPPTTTARAAPPRRRVTAATTTPQPTTTASASPPRRTAGRRTTTTKRPQPTTPVTTTRRPSTPAASKEADDRTVVVRSDNDVDCFKRGVYIHPDECSKFVVCAPSSRTAVGLRGRVLHCPANQIYLEEIGRCMKGDRDSCEQLKK